MDGEKYQVKVRKKHKCTIKSSREKVLKTQNLKEYAFSGKIKNKLYKNKLNNFDNLEGYYFIKPVRIHTL
jgi:hypothetical protein